MKWLNDRNVKLRERAKDQPYNKLFMSQQEACPYCDTFLRRIDYFAWDYKCKCGIWRTSFGYKENRFEYEKLTEVAPNKHKEGTNHD